MKKIKHRKYYLYIGALFLVFYWCSLPNSLFDDPTAIVLTDAQENLLGARIATDGQWRFPEIDTVPEKFALAVIEFEDRRFYYHPGIDPIGIGRAVVQNIRNGKVVSGGSTLTMQVIRMAQKAKSRSLFQKILETILATRLELTYSKEEILALYASHAPFGGNVVGLDAAAWRYYGKRPALLSWGEAATLAVLPNSPALIHPGRNREALVAKRNRLLDRLQNNQIIDSLTCSLAKSEDLPEKPHPLPQLAPHLLDRAYTTYFKNKSKARTCLATTIDLNLQQQVAKVLNRQLISLKDNDIHNIAALVLDVERNEVLAYVGNVIGAGAAHGEQVDIIKAPRSTGSILKPFLYALMLQEGNILPQSLIPDIPTELSGYRPENYHEKYDGVVTAHRALIRSLNVPMVSMLQNYGLEKFHHELQQLGLSTINRPATYYGLPLILGGAEATLWDISNVYAGMSRTLNHFGAQSGQYSSNDFVPATYVVKSNSVATSILQNEPTRFSAAACWLTFQAMSELERPNSEGEWRRFRSRDGIAWKTGTSFGFRDAWAVGVNTKFVVGVWAGNADGEGRPELIGIKAAAPVLFDIFSLLPTAENFSMPYDDLVKIPVCQESGYRPLNICPVDTVWGTQNGINVATCPYHKLIHLGPSGQFRVHGACELPTNMLHQPWLVLPTIEEFYYQSKNPNYKPLPPYRVDCRSTTLDEQPLQVIYPKADAQIYVPINLDGTRSSTVFTATHREPAGVIYWHLDNEYLGSTQYFHEMQLQPSTGEHHLTLVDENGSRVQQKFEIVSD